MARKAVINGTNATSGVVENVVVAEPGFTISGKTLVDAGSAGPGWTWNGGSSFTAPAVVAPRAWTPLQMQAALITSAEWSAIVTAARQSDALFNWMMQFVAAQEVNLDDPRTIAGLGALVTAGLLTSARRDRILTGLPPE